MASLAARDALKICTIAWWEHPWELRLHFLLLLLLLQGFHPFLANSTFSKFERENCFSNLIIIFICFLLQLMRAQCRISTFDEAIAFTFWSDQNKQDIAVGPFIDLRFSESLLILNEKEPFRRCGGGLLSWWTFLSLAYTFLSPATVIKEFPVKGSWIECLRIIMETRHCLWISVDLLPFFF